MTAFYPDPNPETNTVDGSVGRNESNTFLNIRNGAGTIAGDSEASTSYATQIWINAAEPNFSRCGRGIYLFDTSAIGGDSISAAFMSIYTGGNTLTFTVNSFGLAIDVTNPASNTALVAADYGTFSNVAQSETIAIPADTTRVTLNLNATGLGNIITDGITKFGLREKNYDLDGVEPTWESGALLAIDGYFADDTSGTKDPYLDVTHTPVATNGNSTIKYYYL